MTCWCQFGLDPQQFWRTTLRQYDIIMHGIRRKLTDEHNARMSLAWHIAALQHQKKLPKLNTIMRPYPRTRPQTVEEQKRIVQMMVQASRGN